MTSSECGTTSTTPLSSLVPSRKKRRSPLSRATLSHFFTGRHSDPLYCGRGHHFHRYDICAVTSIEFCGVPDNSLFYREIASGFIGLSIGEGRVTEQPKVPVIFSMWDAISRRGSLVARGSGLCVLIKVTRLSLFDGLQ